MDYAIIILRIIEIYSRIIGSHFDPKRINR